MKKELKSGILSADKSADHRPTVGGVNVIAVLTTSNTNRTKCNPIRLNQSALGISFNKIFEPLSNSGVA